MPTVTYVYDDGSQQTVQVAAATSLMRAALANEIPGIVGECGGSATCGTCHVYLDRSTEQFDPPSGDEEDMLEWTAAPRAVMSRTPGPGVDAAGPDSTSSTASPAFAPAAAVNRQWFDQRRPLVTSVSAPAARAAPTRNSRLRSLFPPKASGSRSSRLTQISVRPPRAADSRGRGSSGDGPWNSRKRGISGVEGDMAGW